MRKHLGFTFYWTDGNRKTEAAKPPAYGWRWPSQGRERIFLFTKIATPDRFPLGPHKTLSPGAMALGSFVIKKRIEPRPCEANDSGRPSGARSRADTRVGDSY